MVTMWAIIIQSSFDELFLMTAPPPQMFTGMKAISKYMLLQCILQYNHIV